MSVVACVVKKDSIQIAADSLISNGMHRRDGLSFKKIKKFSNFIIGATGSVQEIQLLYSYASEFPPPNNLKELTIYMADFYKQRDELHESLCPGEKNGMTSDITFVIIISNKAFVVSDFYIDEIKTFHAIGSGENYALGALAAGADVREAVRIACKYQSECGLPVHFFEVLKKGK